MKKISLIILAIIVGGCAFYIINSLNTTAIVISNWRSDELKNVKIETRENIIEVGAVLPNESRTVLLPHKFGESDIKMTFNNGKIWQGGYIEDYNKIGIVYSDTGIDSTSIPFHRYLLGMDGVSQFISESLETN